MIFLARGNLTGIPDPGFLSRVGLHPNDKPDLVGYKNLLGLSYIFNNHFTSKPRAARARLKKSNPKTLTSEIINPTDSKIRYFVSPS